MRHIQIHFLVYYFSPIFHDQLQNLSCKLCIFPQAGQKFKNEGFILIFRFLVAHGELINLRLLLFSFNLNRDEGGYCILKRFKRFCTAVYHWVSDEISLVR